MTDEVWTTARACEERGISRNTLELAIRRGHITPLPYRSERGERVFLASDVRALRLPGQGRRTDLSSGE